MFWVIEMSKCRRGGGRGSSSTRNTGEVTGVADFELADCWDEGKSLKVSQEWAVCIVTPNLVRTRISIG